MCKGFWQPSTVALEQSQGSWDSGTDLRVSSWVVLILRSHPRFLSMKDVVEEQPRWPESVGWS
jgi:hypothetical protein